MGTIRRQSIQATMIMAVGVVLGFGLKLYIFPKFLEPEQIGLLAVLLDSANLFAAFIPLGSRSIFIKYLPHFRDSTGTVKGLSVIGFTLAFLGFIIFTILFFSFKPILVTFYQEKATLFSRYFIFLLPLVFARVIYSIGSSYSIAFKMNIAPLVIKEIIVRLLTGILVLAFATSYFSLDGLVLLYVGIYFFSGSLITLYLRKLNYLDLKPKLTKLRNGYGKQIVEFGLFSVLTSAGSVIIMNIDTLMITSLSSLYDAGIYSIAFFIGLIIEMPRRALTQISSPFIAESMAKGNLNQVNTIYRKSSINQLLIGGLFLILVWTNLENLFNLMPNGTRFSAGKYVVLFIGLGKLVNMSMGVNSQIIQNSSYYRFNFYNMITLALVAISINLMLIPRMGITGAALSSLISLTIINIIRGIFLRKKLGLQPFGKNIFTALAIALLTYLAAIFSPNFDSQILEIILRSGITITTFIILVFYTKVSEDLNKILHATCKLTVSRKTKN